jgi:hypothetical protein
MCSFRVADVITGRNIAEGQPVVAFLVNSQHGRYPLDGNANALGHSAGHFFAIESFPIFGTSDDCGMVDVEDESQLAVRLALRMTGTNDWETLTENAFSTRKGVRFLGRPEQDEATRRVYGMCLMHRDTYDHLVLQGRSLHAKTWTSDGFVGEYRDPTIRQQDIDEVKAVLTSCMTSPNNVYRLLKQDWASRLNDFAAASNLSRICALNADHYVLDEVLPGRKLPTLMTALSSSDGHQVGSDLCEVLRTIGILGQGLLESPHLSANEMPDLDELLGLLWDVIHLRTRMYEIHAHYHPSFYAGQDHNFPSVLELARATHLGVWAEMLALRVKIDGDADSPDLDAELAALEDTLAKMRESLRAARAKDGG